MTMTSLFMLIYFIYRGVYYYMLLCSTVIHLETMRKETLLTVHYRIL